MVPTFRFRIALKNYIVDIFNGIIINNICKKNCEYHNYHVWHGHIKCKVDIFVIK